MMVHSACMLAGWATLPSISRLPRVLLAVPTHLPTHAFSIYSAPALALQQDTSGFPPEELRRSCSDVLLYALGLVSVMRQALEAALALGLVRLDMTRSATLHSATPMPWAASVAECTGSRVHTGTDHSIMCANGMLGTTAA